MFAENNFRFATPVYLSSIEPIDAVLDTRRVRSSEVFVASAGVAASEGAPTSPETCETLRRHGIEFEGHSNALTPEMIRNAHAILCMTKSHAELAEFLVEDDPESIARIEMLDPDRDLPDPIGQGQAVYDALADRLMKLLPDRLDALLKDDES